MKPGSIKLISLVLILLPFALSCCKPEKPNIVLIMADDMGYECLGTYGSISYQTPVLDSLAFNGIKFSNCISQPLCTPSRVKIMTGMYNYRNYEYFGYLNSNQYTFGNLMKDAGYSTCIAGKWQLNGLAYKDQIAEWNNNTRPIAFGFDEYCLWQLTKTRGEGERFSKPLIEQNGEILQTNSDDYGPDIFCDFIIDFIDRKKDVPFFIYYPMVLVHEPFVPTPDSRDWANKDLRYRNDTVYFRDMVEYTDKIVGEIAGRLKELKLDDNTILIFTGDNGTHFTILTDTEQGTVRGAKGNTIDHGIHVPLIAYWPEKIKKGLVFDPLIEFSDFFPTFADIAGVPADVDGKSFFPLLSGGDYIPRQTAFVHYDPRWGARVNQYRNQFVMTDQYKLYQDGKFFDHSNDVLEERPLDKDSLKGKALEIRAGLEKELSRHPNWK
jgi:arylsulfatase A